MTERRPIFQSVFGAQWESLPPVMRKHYANRPKSCDVTIVKGVMRIEVSRALRFFAPLLRVLKSFPPYAGENIPVTVHFRSEPDSAAFCFDRIFYFPDRPPYRFRSKMFPVGGDETVEFMPFGVGWRARFRAQGPKIYLEHKGYCVKAFGRLVRLPVEWIVGEGHAEEEALDDSSFRMFMALRHPLFGALYGYSGRFAIVESEP